MNRIRVLCVLLVAALFLPMLGSGAQAAQVDCDTVYCFTAEDFSPAEPLRGICVTRLPEASAGTVMLGSRVVQPGDILTAQQLSQLTFQPLRTEVDQEAMVTYLPIYGDRVEKCTSMTISIRGKEDQKPVAQDSTMETYKNLPNTGNLKVSDPEGQTLTYTLVRAPRRGEVTIGEDGSFTYTPKKNKVGVDSFTYTATDPAGNVSREATVTVQILKPTDARQYTDTVGTDCRFAAEWMRNTGLFVGETIGEEACFQPEKTVSRGEFLTMVVKLLEIPVTASDDVELPADVPGWLQPYLAAAIRSGLISQWPQSQTGSFGANDAVTGGEAAVMLQSALDLTASQATVETALLAQEEGDPQTAWAQSAVAVLAEYGICLEADRLLTRGQIAQVLYKVNELAVDAPGLAVIRMQR